MQHEMKLKPIYYNKIMKGQKIYEGRLNDEKRRNIKIGDIIIFKNESNLSTSLKTVVKDLLYFNSFKDLINTLPLEKLGFENSDKNEVEKIYHTFYTVEDETRFGVVAIKVELLK